MSVYLSDTVARTAEETQADHAPNEDGWCRFCLRHHRIRVRAGECTPHRRAAGFLQAYQWQRTRQRARFSPPRPGDVTSR